MRCALVLLLPAMFTGSVVGCGGQTTPNAQGSGGAGHIGGVGAGGSRDARGGTGGETSTGGAATGGSAIGGRGGNGGSVVGGLGGGGGSGPAGSTDAALFDAGRAADAHPATATDGGTTTSCAGLFCEDFEKGVIDPNVWEIQVHGASQVAPNVVTQASLVAHGKYAAHFRANPNVVSYDFMITRNPPAALKGHHFGRAYFMITPKPPAEHTEFIFSGTSGFPQLKYLEVASVGVPWQLTYVDLVPPGTGEDYHSGGQVPLEKWVCLEWEFNDAPDQAAVYLNGNSTANFAQNKFTFNGASTGLVGGFAAFGFGYYVWHPATYVFDVYYDDIVLDTKRIGCLE